MKNHKKGQRKVKGRHCRHILSSLKRNRKKTTSNLKAQTANVI